MAATLVFHYKIKNFLFSFYGYLLFQIILHDRIMFIGLNNEICYTVNSSPAESA